jgi:signal transduction histidine kinase
VTNTSTEGEVPDLSLLTEPLYRGDAGRQAPGFGLGLSIVKTVVESHNWQLQLETAGPGDARGETSFVILIPR